MDHFYRYAFGRGQAIFDVGFGGDDRIFSVVADPLGYHLVSVPKQPGSVWVMETLPDPAQTCRVRTECQLAPHSKQVLAYTVPPHIENNQTNVAFKTFPEGIPVLAQGSSTEKAHFVVAEQINTPNVTVEFSFNYTRRVLTVKTPQPGQRLPIIHVHDTLAKICLSSDPGTFNWHETVFQNWLHTSGLRRVPHEDEIMFGRRVQQHMSQTLIYTPVSQVSKAGGAAALCMQRETDAAGHAVLFVSIMRANSIPARVLCGRWISNDILPSDHFRAEFFADNVGWIPVETIEKGESLYFGSDPKAPFVVMSFGEMNSSFRIASSTQFQFKDRLPVTVTLPWREAHFMWIAGNINGMGSQNFESWSSAIGDANAQMPNLPGQAHQTPSNQRFSKAHDTNAPPSVGARARPYAQSTPAAPGYMPHHLNSTAPAPYAAPPPVPNRSHAHNSVQVTTFGGPSPQPGYIQSQQPPPLPPHGSHYSPQVSPHGGPPQLSPRGGGGGPPPQLPPQNNGGYNGYSPHSSHNGGPPPQLPPQQNNGYHQGGYQQPQQPPLPQHNTLPAPGPYTPQGPSPNSTPRGGYGSQPPLPQPGYGQGPPPQIPPQQQQQQQPQQQYQQYGNQPPQQSNAPPMHVPSVSQPRPVSTAPQHHLANMESAHANASLESAQAGGTAQEQINPVSAAPKKAPVKVAVLPPGPLASPGGTPVKPSAAKASSGFPPKQGAAKVPGLPVGAAAKKVGGSVSPRPRVFARAMYDHLPQDSLELQLSRGDIVEIFSEDESGWWKAERFGKSGIVPAPYMEKLPPGTRVAKATYPFDAHEATDLRLQVGEFAVINQSEGDWWQAEAHGNQGNIPSNYVQLLG